MGYMAYRRSIRRRVRYRRRYAAELQADRAYAEGRRIELARLQGRYGMIAGSLMYHWLALFLAGLAGFTLVILIGAL